MPDWRDRILKALTPGVVRLTLERFTAFEALDFEPSSDVNV